MPHPRVLAVARGDAPADLLLRGARVVDLVGRRIVATEVAIVAGRIAALGRRQARETIDLGGAFLAPGLIDAHLHVESSLVGPRALAEAVVCFGTTTLVADPHEIANVLGLDGVRFMLAEAARAAISIPMMAPSCVPASPLSTGGARIGMEELAILRAEPGILGLGEVMSFPAVVAGEEEILAKLALFAGRPIDGHAPGLSGPSLAAYAAAGIGSDHECATADEVRERVALGMTVFLREATNARDLDALLGAVDETSSWSLAFCTDDRTPGHLLDEGSVDGMVRRAIAAGVDPIVALGMATAVPAAHFGLHDRGAVLPGRRADLVVFDDLEAPRPRLVFVEGRLRARDGELVGLGDPDPGLRAPEALRATVRVAWDRLDWELPAPSGRPRARAVELVPDQLVTREAIVEVPIEDGRAEADPARDLLHLGVIERHRASGRIARGLVRGFGLRRGALASTIAHDHHNLIVVGADAISMRAAAERAGALGGGLVVAAGEEILAELALPLAGLMSDESLPAVRRRHDRVREAARSLGATPADPFMALSFAGLEVIPALKLTDRGLVDVARGEIVPLWVD